MKLYTKEQYEQLVKNGGPNRTSDDNFPVVKWFTPDANWRKVLELATKDL